MKLMDLVMNHNKWSLEAAGKRANDLLTTKDLASVHGLVAQDVTNQINEYTNYATSAYLLGCEAQTKLIEACHDHAKDHSDLTNEAVLSFSKSSNPLTAMAAAIAQAAIGASNAAIVTAKASSKSWVNLKWCSFNFVLSNKVI